MTDLVKLIEYGFILQASHLTLMIWYLPSILLDPNYNKYINKIHKKIKEQG